MSDLHELLAASASAHKHLCPRQVLGVRMGLRAGRDLGLDVPRQDKRLFAIAETDGCFVDGIMAATGCSIGHRTLRLMDFGKVAVTFVDVRLEQAIRIAPRPDIRGHAGDYAPGQASPWHTQLLAYQRMPDDALLLVQPVILTFSLRQWLSKPGHRIICDRCGEEVLNEREVVRDGLTLCQACSGMTYYLGKS